MSGSIGNRYLKTAKVLDEGLCMLPFSFVTRGTGTPDTVKGAIVQSNAGVSTLVRVSAGLFTFTMTDLPFEVTSASVDTEVSGAEDYSSFISANSATGVVTITIKTGTANVDMTTGRTVWGILWLRYTDRTMTK